MIFAIYFCSLYREEEAIKLDGLNVAQMKELRDKAEKHVFQAEVDRMMKLIINSLYKNKEVCIILDLFINIYILCVFTEKPYSKPLERNVVYIPIITLSHAMSVCQNNP